MASPTVLGLEMYLRCCSCLYLSDLGISATATFGRQKLRSACTRRAPDLSQNTFIRALRSEDAPVLVFLTPLRRDSGAEYTRTLTFLLTC